MSLSKLKENKEQNCVHKLTIQIGLLWLNHYFAMPVGPPLNVLLARLFKVVINGDACRWVKSYVRLTDMLKDSPSISTAFSSLLHLLIGKQQTDQECGQGFNWPINDTTIFCAFYLSVLLYFSTLILPTVPCTAYARQWSTNFKTAAVTNHLELNWDRS